MPALYVDASLETCHPEDGNIRPVVAKSGRAVPNKRLVRRSLFCHIPRDCRIPADAKPFSPICEAVESDRPTAPFVARPIAGRCCHAEPLQTSCPTRREKSNVPVARGPVPVHIAIFKGNRTPFSCASSASGVNTSRYLG